MSMSADFDEYLRKACWSAVAASRTRL